jgi:hypothetical protein
MLADGEQGLMRREVARGAIMINPIPPHESAGSRKHVWEETVIEKGRPVAWKRLKVAMNRERNP